MDGFNLKNQRDSFSFKNNILSVCMEIKKVFTRPTLKVNINGKEYNVLGRLGMYHTIVDITGAENITIGNEVILNVAPLYTNPNIRREYI